VDLRLYGRVVWRFRWIVLVGLILAVALATMSYARVSLRGGTPHLTPRDNVIWQSSGTLNVTRSGFPDGSLVSASDPNRFPTLAIAYSQYVSSDPVRRLIAKMGGRRILGQVSATPVRGPGGDVLPFLRVSAAATTAEGARVMAQIGIEALQRYIAEQQNASGIPIRDRVILQELQQPNAASVLAGRSKVRPFAVLIIVLLATVALAFILENMRPRIRATEPANDAAEQRPSAARRSA
jgi:hypothetical protein